MQGSEATYKNPIILSWTTTVIPMLHSITKANEITMAVSCTDSMGAFTWFTYTIRCPCQLEILATVNSSAIGCGVASLYRSGNGKGEDEGDKDEKMKKPIHGVEILEVSFEFCTYRWEKKRYVSDKNLIVLTNQE